MRSERVLLQRRRVDRPARGHGDRGHAVDPEPRHRPYVHFRFWLHGELHVRTVKHETYESALDEVNTFNAFRMAIAMSDAALMRRQRDELLAAARRHIDATRAMEALSNLVTRIEGGAK